MDRQKPYPIVVWRTQLVRDEPGYTVKEISKHRWFSLVLFSACNKMGEERDKWGKKYLTKKLTDWKAYSGDKGKGVTMDL